MAASEAAAQFTDIEVVTFEATYRIDANDITDTNTLAGDRHTVEGIPVIDYDNVVDRNEALHLLQAHHRLVCWVNGGENATPSTQYGVAATAAEVSASPSQSAVSTINTTTTATDGEQVRQSPFSVGVQDDSIDLIGPPLSTKVGQDFSETTGAGGANAEGDDDWASNMFPAEFGRFHPRDELFVSADMRFWNMDVAGFYAEVLGQHVYGVIED